MARKIKVAQVSDVGPTITCPWHGWQYDVTTGANVRNPAVKVASFNVKVEGADILVELP
jgi:nitrite reductase/ring-hydroxylating ferredoxin subunit